MKQLRVLIAWEIGENFGHVLPLLAIARRLRDGGHGRLLGNHHWQLQNGGKEAVMRPVRTEIRPAASRHARPDLH